MPTGTLGDLKARIATELRRDDLTTEIADAITTAINSYKRERLRWNESQPLAPFTFNTVAGNSFYDKSTDERIGNLYKIDWMNVLIGGTYAEMRRSTPEDLRLAIDVPGTQNGQPDEYAYEGETLIIYPTPNAAYTITVGGHFVYAAPADDTEANNRWMTDGELLIRARAKFEIARHVTRNKDMQAAMSPHEPSGGEMPGEAWSELRRIKGETSRLVGRGRIAPMRF